MESPSSYAAVLGTDGVADVERIEGLPRPFHDRSPPTGILHGGTVTEIYDYEFI